jgi:hypothetical protein
VRQETRDTLDSAYSIASEYGGNLTVRQLYYQLVARGFIENSQRSYKRLVSILSDARLAGEFPFEWLLDRTRECRPGDFGTDSTSVYRALRSAADELREAPERWLWRSIWWGQPTHVSVWVEKEALSGVFEEPCDRLGVSWFVLRGYSSLSSLSQWVDTVDEAQSNDPAIEEAVVLYFGDHDPDGWEIPRSAERNVDAIAEVRGIELPPVAFDRIALNRDQIEQYNPPPFPAKETSSRFDSYFREHGIRSAWELDALRPDTLASLIADAIAPYFSREVWAENRDEVREARREMRKAMMTDGWAAKTLEE